MVAVGTALTIAPAAPAAPPTATISNTINAATADGGTLTGTLSNLQFVNQAGQLVLQGVLNGTFTSATGVVTQITNQAISLPLIGAAPAGTCSILDLTLGP